LLGGHLGAASGRQVRHQGGPVALSENLLQPAIKVESILDH
jgi:hypothetical protein